MSPKVIILGGGVAGMSAAHELIERGFTVEVYEKKPEYVGGKARSVNVPDSGKAGRLPLPGEHGFRFFPGFYRHVTDTMKRIPFKNPKTGKVNKRGVFDNLVQSNKMMMARFDQAPIIALSRFPTSLADLEIIYNDLFHTHTGLKPGEAKLMAHRLWQLMTSCKTRRLDDYESIGWWEFTDADEHSDAYKALFVNGLTRTLVAAKARKASTKTGGDILIQLVFDLLNPEIQVDRVLNGPTNDVWLNPWYDYLVQKGVRYEKGQELVEFVCDKQTITGVVLEDANGSRKTVRGDFYLSALPVEAMAPLVNENMLYKDACLTNIVTLANNVDWMNGIQFYLSDEVNIIDGHIICVDTPWALTAISQLQFWADFDISKYGDGAVKTVLSVDVSDWETPGILYNKTAQQCSFTEIKEEVWAQLKRSFNVEGKVILHDQSIVTYYIDSDIVEKNGKTVENTEKLLVNLTNTWDLRPNSYTGIPNLFLASDYVKTFTDLASMEGANEAARRAVNNIIKRSGSNAPLCTLWDLHEPFLLLPFRWLDKIRYQRGLCWNPNVPKTVQTVAKLNAIIQKTRQVVKRPFL
ncbi:hydroxysqualene dehydroxylase [Larkinella rosea]|uniref:FAD-binding protein n=1 Tax=Larkinella rosea TaxID=2025312 RepID=A0A3P1C2R5_9BACT|nr:FAD-dependent oxidoreductase [Larkinella rosea]RRB07700.1 FAD-binding protein [Larkinella rosea]